MKGILNDSSQAHEAAVKATVDPKPNIIRPPSPSEEKKESNMIQKTKERGIEVEIDDEGQAVDKVQLLSAGLNPGKKRRVPQGPLLPPTVTKDQNIGYKRQAVGTSASQSEIRARHSKMVEEQMLAFEKEKEREAKHAFEQKETKTLERRNDESSIEAAKRRFAERRAKAKSGSTL